MQLCPNHSPIYIEKEKVIFQGESVSFSNFPAERVVTELGVGISKFSNFQ